MHDVFISFSFKDEAVANKIVDKLGEFGILSWICTERIRSGSNFYDEISNAITASRILVFIQTKNSVESKEIPDEVFQALDEGKTIISFILEDSELHGMMKLKLKSRQHIDARKTGLDTAVAELAEEIRKIIKNKEIYSDDYVSEFEKKRVDAHNAVQIKKTGKFKWTFILLLIVTVFVSLVIVLPKISDETETENSHIHSFSYEWNSDINAHWHICTCGEKSDFSIHTWQDSDCSSPKTCIYCKLTEGEPLEHQWNLLLDVAKQECSLCGKTENVCSIDYNVNFPSELTNDVDTVPTLMGTLSNVATDIVAIDNKIEIRNLTSRTVRKELAHSNKQSLTYFFKGWNIEGGDVVIEPGRSFNYNELKAYADDNGRIILNGAWEDATRYNSVSFFIRFDSQLVDTSGNVVSRPDESYTTEIFNTYVGGVDKSLSDKQIKETFTISADVAENPDSVDKEIRNLTNEVSNGIWLYDFPTDDYVFEYLRKYMKDNLDRRFLTDDEVVNPDELNGTYYVIRWYVFKLEDASWHIDGRLVRK